MQRRPSLPSGGSAQPPDFVSVCMHVHAGSPLDKETDQHTHRWMFDKRSQIKRIVVLGLTPPCREAKRVFLKATNLCVSACMCDVDWRTCQADVCVAITTNSSTIHLKPSAAPLSPVPRSPPSVSPSTNLSVCRFPHSPSCFSPSAAAHCTTTQSEASCMNETHKHLRVQ